MQTKTEQTGVNSYPPTKQFACGVVKTGVHMFTSDYARLMAGAVFGVWYE